ncbi:MAG: DUF2344 domain-containing protein, partial [Selenomonadaceae bacterium]|nr:DUF2344 domain-containing protein [Selenomonadaceae bacterium]
KLYFMMGLPTETDEDIAGIADLAQKVVNLYRSIKNRRDVKVTVSVSCFVPKPWTPFQWTAQISAEEFERRQQFLKSLIVDKAITYNYHNAKLSVLEGALARGDRRLAKVIETAWRFGAKFDGWSDLFKPDAWEAAFEACGIDMNFYGGRERDFWEALPWEHTSPAVDKSFLLAEWEKSQVGETTRDCRHTNCTGCGVCMNLGAKIVRSEEAGVRSYDAQSTSHSSLSTLHSPLPTPNRYKYRAQIRKGEEIAVLSHLDYMKVFMRALLRSKLPAAWSEGFNPHMIVSFASALGVGVTSDCEYVDFELTAPVAEFDVAKRLNEQLPKGSEIVRLKRLRGKAPAAMTLADMSRWEVRLPLAGKDLESVRESIKRFSAATEVKFTRVTPKKTREMDAKKYLAEPVTLTVTDDELIIRFATKIFPDGTLKPSEVLFQSTHLAECDLADAKINRTALLGCGEWLVESD